MHDVQRCVPAVCSLGGCRQLPTPVYYSIATASYNLANLTNHNWCNVQVPTIDIHPRFMLTFELCIPDMFIFSTFCFCHICVGFSICKHSASQNSGNTLVLGIWRIYILGQNPFELGGKPYQLSQTQYPISSHGTSQNLCTDSSAHVARRSFNGFLLYKLEFQDSFLISVLPHEIVGASCELHHNWSPVRSAGCSYVAYKIWCVLDFSIFDCALRTYNTKSHAQRVDGKT